MAWAQHYLTVKAQPGDGIHVLLNRYKLDRNTCNYTLFYKINRLSKGAHLIAHRNYKLPIKTYTFDGKTIRGSASIPTWKQAKQVERFNDNLHALKIKKEDFRKGKRQLWVPHHVLQCPNKAEDFVPRTRTFPIFGKKHAHVPLIDKKLAGAVYYIVAGHGGPDPGALGKYKGHMLCEDEYAYDIALRLARKLIAHGALVYVITRDPNDGIRSGEILPCDKDERCWKNEVIPINQKARLTQRSEAINALYEENKARGVEYQRTLVIHVDSRSRSERIDLFFYHHPDNDVARIVAKRMHETIAAKYAIHRKNGKYYGAVSARDLHMIRETKPTSVFVELANIQNPYDQKRIVIESNREALADWFCEGLMRDY